MTVPSLWSDRNFAIFWGVQAFSEVGNAFSLVAVPLLVLHTTGSVAQMGLLTAVAAVGSLGTGLVGGTWADRFDRRQLLMLCDAARLVLYAAVAICWTVSPQIWLLFVVMGLASIFEMLFRITYVTVIPSLVDHSRIIEANGRLETTNALAYIAGPALAGLVSGVFGPTAAISINAASFGVSLIGLAFIRFRPIPVERSRPGRAGFVVGVHFLWRTPVLRSLTLLLTVTTFVSLGMTDVFIYHLRNELGQDEKVVGYVLGLAGLGTCVAAAATASLRRSWGFGWCWLGALSLVSAAVLLLSQSDRLVVAAVTICLYSFGMALAGVCSIRCGNKSRPSTCSAGSPQRSGPFTAAWRRWERRSLRPALVGRVGTRVPLLTVAAGALLLRFQSGNGQSAGDDVVGQVVEQTIGAEGLGPQQLQRLPRGDAIGLDREALGQPHLASPLRGRGVQPLMLRGPVRVLDQVGGQQPVGHPLGDARHLVQVLRPPG
jgi:MFS family permease